MESEPKESRYTGLTDLHKRLQILADRLGQTGRTEQKEHARSLSQRIVQHLLGSGLECSADGSPPGLETLARLFQLVDIKKMASHEDRVIRLLYVSFVGEWLALSVGSLSPFRSSSSAANYDRDPEAGALALITAIREKCSKLGLADFLVPETMGVVVGDAVREAAEHRKHGRLDDARATVARLMTIARRLVREYPDSADTYRVLSEAHNQVKKNAFKTNDDHLIEEALVQAVEAAERAASLDPGWIEARGQLARLTEQLASIKADRKAAGSSLP